MPREFELEPLLHPINNNADDAAITHTAKTHFRAFMLPPRTVSKRVEVWLVANAALETLHAVVLVILWSKTAARRRLLLVNARKGRPQTIAIFFEMENSLNLLAVTRKWTQMDSGSVAQVVEHQAVTQLGIWSRKSGRNTMLLSRLGVRADDPQYAK